MSTPVTTIPQRVLPLRARIAVTVGKTTARLSRLAGAGSGSVIGGRASLMVDPELLTHLCAGRSVVLVSATNGKTTTTRLIASALETDRPVVSNSLGSNMPTGHVAALSETGAETTAVLEVDEQWLSKVMPATRPQAVVLSNLSRDQLDRSHEVKKIAEAWREALSIFQPDHVIANSSDPLIVWAAMESPNVHWVQTRSGWQGDAVGCPRCGTRLELDDERWACPDCGLAQPGAHSRMARPSDTDPDTELLVGPDGTAIALTPSLPGEVNKINAAMALATAKLMGADAEHAMSAMTAVTDVAGRYSTITVAGVEARMLLAKNPAGWREALSMASPAPTPVVIAVNARIADGRDPSWLWDVPFEVLGDRPVVISGERRLDLAVRLHYAEVRHLVAETLEEAVTSAGATKIDVIANYTAFADWLGQAGSGRRTS